MNTLINNLKQACVDKTARKPSGWIGKSHFKNPQNNYPEFQRALEILRIRPDDVLLDVACGGGILLKMALETISRGTGIDHSHDMIEAAKENNSDAISNERAEIVYGSAQALPLQDGTFTCAAIINAFFFFESPEVVLDEINRVLKRGGRLVIGNIVPPQKGIAKLMFSPWASEMIFHANSEMHSILSNAGFNNIKIENLDNKYVFYYGEKKTIKTLLLI